MSVHTGNKLIWIIAGCLAFIAVVIIASTLQSSPTVTTTDVKTREPSVPVVDVEADTPEETLQSLVKNTNQITSRSNAQDKEIERLKSELSQVASLLADSQRELDKLQATDGDEPASVLALQKKLNRLEAQVNKNAAARAPGTNNNVLPVNNVPQDFGFTSPINELSKGFNVINGGFTGRHSRSNTANANAVTSHGYVRILPMSAADATSPLGDALKTAALPDLPKLDDKAEVEPRYTIPMNATLYEATAMTAMVGRVPVRGSVRDPFEVKLILGRENLAANGLRIPGLSGMIFAGVATGDWNLSCVSTDIMSATYVWDDGRIQTITADSLKKTRSDSNRASQQTSVGGKRIGWISTRQGIPCVPGKRISDAATAGMLQVLLAVGEGYSAAMAQAQTTTRVTESGSTLTSVTGDKNDYYKNMAAAKAIDEAGNIIRERWRETFDAIFVPPGYEIAVNISRTLPVDYDPNARKLAYNANADNTKRTLD